MSLPSRVVAGLTGSALLVVLVLLLVPTGAAAPTPGGNVDAGVATAAAAGSAADAASPARSAAGAGERPAERSEAIAPGSGPGTAPAADDPLTILVRDASDRPVAGVPVALRAGAGRDAPVWEGVTRAPDGLAEVRQPRALLRQRSGPVTAVALLAMRPVPAVALDRSALPAEPVKLVLPPAGQVVVWIDDATEAEAEQMTVTLAVPAAAPDTGFTAEASARPRGGAATFPFVGLGLSLLARAARPGQNEAARTTLNGPTVDGEVVQVRMRVLPPADRVVLVMHLQDARGQPMRGRRVDVALEARVRGSVTSGTFTMEADDEGVLRLVADEDFGTMPERTLRLRSRPQDAGEPTEAVVTVPPALSPGVNDLGIVAMLPPPLVCAGLVVDHAGRPVADAELDVRVLPNAAGVPGREPREVRGVHGRSDRTGRFTVRGGTPEGELQLGVRAPGFLPRDGVTFLPGASDLRIELAAAAALAGSVELDELVTAVDVLVELKSGGVTRRARLRVNGARGEFRFDSLEAGTATVAVRLLGEPGSLLVEGIPLQPGEVQRDPRLQEVDLGAGRRAVCFAVVDQDGQPAKDVRIAVLHGGDQRSFEGYMSSCGRGRIVTRARPLDVLVFGAGYRSVRVPDLADGATIELRAPLRVRVRLPAGCPAPTPPFALEARIDPGNAAWPANVSFRFYEGLGGETSGDGTPPWVRGARARIGPGGDAVLDVPEPGTWTLSWRMSRHEGQDRVDRWFQSDPAAIAVRDEAAEQAVTAGPRSEQLEAARARLEAR